MKFQCRRWSFVCFLAVVLMAKTGHVGAEEKTVANTKFAPSALAALKKLAANETRNGLYSGAAVADDGVKKYSVWNLEFGRRSDCKAFDVPEVTVITRFGRFADVFMPADETVLRKVVASPGLVWLDWNTGGVIPPPVRAIPSQEEPRQIPDQIVQGGAMDSKEKG